MSLESIVHQFKKLEALVNNISFASICFGSSVIYFSVWVLRSDDFVLLAVERSSYAEALVDAISRATFTIIFTIVSTSHFPEFSTR